MSVVWTTLGYRGDTLPSQKGCEQEKSRFFEETYDCGAEEKTSSSEQERIEEKVLSKTFRSKGVRMLSCASKRPGANLPVPEVTGCDAHPCTSVAEALFPGEQRREVETLSMDGDNF